MKIVITGGHHSSALPVIKKLKEINPLVDIHWFGHKHSLKGDKNPTLEYIEITGLGITFYNLLAGKLYKTFDITRLLKVPFGVIHALFLLHKIKPNLIVSFGGYLAAPTVLAGWLLGIPSITHEQTLVVGYANKFISYFAKKVLVSFESSTKYFDANKVLYTGLPLRSEIFESVSRNFLLSDLPTLYITAGKTGSHKINQQVYSNLGNLLSKYNIIHQCGDYSELKDFETLTNKYLEIKHLVPGKYYLRKFIFANEIGEAFQKSNLVVSRSGAHSCFELLTLQKPCLLIPIPWVSHNEQYLNAKYLEDMGIAQILEEKDINGSAFIQKIDEMILNISSFKLNPKLPLTQKLDSADLIVKEILKYAS